MPLLRLSWDAWRKILEVDRRWRLDQAEFFNAIRQADWVLTLGVEERTGARGSPDS
jgi:hypothetical protein